MTSTWRMHAVTHKSFLPQLRRDGPPVSPPFWQGRVRFVENTRQMALLGRHFGRAGFVLRFCDRANGGLTPAIGPRLHLHQRLVVTNCVCKPNGSTSHDVMSACTPASKRCAVSRPIARCSSAELPRIYRGENPPSCIMRPLCEKASIIRFFWTNLVFRYRLRATAVSGAGRLAAGVPADGIVGSRDSAIAVR
jgi:hypothetical protein